ncbi:Dolichol-phosphate mannosyltransferase [Methanosarcina horonobensis HB-1 = JCM 15518]|uniref:Dolichol-phosphate mannosyltransferase n=2 Tax=Methanosarcina horonobensis TaxID=418008 RepID=A0A0E3SC52_9EURY|nr:Dolichol-phosphate mannosyltransferase [Methanosarcina horonobensis HB-1 = JCM 15518]
MEFDRPLYCFTLPGFILVAGGLYINLNSVQAFYPDGSLSLESTVVILLLPFIGIFMAFIGILMHSITGLIRYKMNNQNK